MPSGNPNIAEYGKATRFKPGVVTNPKGMAPGTKHITTRIQEALEDPKFAEKYAKVLEKNDIQIEGVPLDGVIAINIIKALQGDPKFIDLLYKYGYGQLEKLDVDIDQTVTVITRNAGSRGQVIEAEVVDNDDSNIVDDINDDKIEAEVSENAGLVQNTDTTDDIKELDAPDPS